MLTVKTTWRLLLFSAFIIALGTACESGSGAKEIVEPGIDGKTDIFDTVRNMDRLEMNGEATAEFTSDFEFHAYPFIVGPSSQVTLEVTQRGSSRGLDTTMFLYGPRAEDYSWGDRIGFDDDSGWGDLSRIEAMDLTEAGEYLVVIGTALGDGRGDYRLTLTCTAETCESTEVSIFDTCPEATQDVIDDCVEDTLSEDDYYGETTRGEAFELCLTDYAYDYLWDVLCDSRSNEEWCVAGSELFFDRMLPACREEIGADYLPVEPTVELTSATTSDDLDSLVDDIDCDACWAEINAFTYEAMDTQPSLEGIATSAAARLFDGPMSYDGEVAVEDMQYTLERFMMDEFIDLAIERAGSSNYEIAELSTSYYVAAGAEEWLSIFVLSFDNRYVLTLSVAEGEV